MKKEPRSISLACYIGLGVFFAALLLTFCLLLRQNFLRVTAEDISLWSTGTEPFVWACQAGVQEASVSYDGYIYLESEPLHQVDNRVALYHKASGELTGLSTCMIVRDMPPLNQGPINHAYGGFSAFVKTEKLAHPLAEYEICLLYASNGHRYIQPTGLNGKGESLC